MNSQGDTFLAIVILVFGPGALLLIGLAVFWGVAHAGLFIRWIGDLTDRLNSRRGIG